MDKQVEKRQKLYNAVGLCVQKLREIFRDRQPPSLQLPAALEALAVFEQSTQEFSAESFNSITNRMKILLLGHSASQTALNQLENEMVELAVDWLEQLAMLYKEGLPEPRSLVSELIYTFDLVERSHGAETLAEVMTSPSGQMEAVGDLFGNDPDFDVEERSAPETADPFKEDPGFGLEFDLLQRTLNRMPESRSDVDDPFDGDPHLSLSEDDVALKKGSPEQSSFDVFEDDPPVINDPDK
jgi:hypothetical protein